MLGLTKVSERVALVCSSDPAVGEEGDEWRAATPADKEAGATVVTIRALSTLETLKLMPLLNAASGDETPLLEIYSAYIATIKAAFVSVAEGGAESKDADCADKLSMGQVLTLGALVLKESQPDPTKASASEQPSG